MGQRGKINNLDSFLEEAIDNIRSDRAVTSTLLTDLLVKIKENNADDNHKDFGLIASKYVETLQRSNEQLVKITALLSKKESVSESLTEDDRTQLFDLIQESS
jgi:hypothetical protein